MGDVVEYVREHLFLVVFIGFWLCVFIRSKIKRPKHLAINVINYIENFYLANDIKLVPADPADFPDIMVSQYEQQEIELKEMGFVHLCDYQNIVFNKKYPKYRYFFRTLVSKDYTTSVTLAYHINNDEKSQSRDLSIDFSTEFSNSSYFTTKPAGSSKSFDLGPYVIKRILQDGGVKEAWDYHQERVREYLEDNPDVEVMCTKDAEDIYSGAASSIELFRKNLPEKGCLVSYDDLCYFSGGLPKDFVDKAWQICIAEQKKRGYWFEKKVMPELAEGEVPVAFEDDGADDQIPANELDVIRRHIEISRSGRGSFLKSLPTLIITLVIFFQLGWFKWGIDFVLSLVAILFLHEGGHYLMMKVFGYKNLQMIFLPLMGAAVTGMSFNIATWKKALVSLAGPLPGIFLGLALMFYSREHGNELIEMTAFILLLLNGFNLLPLLPLDGGWVMHYILFSRSYICEYLARTLACVVFFVLAGMTNDFIFHILFIFNLFSLVSFHKEYSFFKTFKGKLDYERLQEESAGRGSDYYIPDMYLIMMIEHLNKKKHITGYKAMAGEVVSLWDRISVKPTGLWATIGILLIYLTGWMGLLVCVFELDRLL